MTSYLPDRIYVFDFIKLRIGFESLIKKNGVLSEVFRNFGVVVELFQKVGNIVAFDIIIFVCYEKLLLRFTKGSD
jgi:hypothetical protein